MLEVPDVDVIRPCGVVVLLCFIAKSICVVVSVILVVCCLCVYISMCLFVLCILCLTLLVNCLLNAFAICVGEVNVFSLKVIVLFLGCVSFFCSSISSISLFPASMVRSPTGLYRYCSWYASYNV